MSTNSDTAAIRMPESVRYQLTANETAAALELAGSAADGTLLAPRPPANRPAEVLTARGLLGADGRLVPVLARALAVAAAPARLIHVVATVPGAPGWADLRIGAAAHGGPFVAVDDVEGGIDLRALESVAELTAVLDGVFRCSSYPTRPVDPDVALPLAGWLGLLAMSDLGQEARLRATLERRRAPGQPVTADGLERIVIAGLGSTDSRWAVTGAVLTAPVDLRGGSRPSGADMIDSLHALGLLAPAAGGFDPTPLGAHLVELVEHAIVVGSLTLSYRRPGRAVRGGELVIYRTPTRLAVGAWSGTSASPVVTLTEPTNEAAVAMLHRFCALPDRGRRRAAATAWRATHIVVEGGANVRAAADAALTPVDALPPDLPVEVCERLGDWARVRTERGVEGWIDGRRLTPL